MQTWNSSLTTLLFLAQCCGVFFWRIELNTKIHLSSESALDCVNGSTVFALADEATLLFLFYILIFKLFQLSFGLQEEADIITMYFWFNEMDAVCENDNIVNGDDVTEVTALAPPPNSIRAVAWWTGTAEQTVFHVVTETTQSSLTTKGSSRARPFLESKQSKGNQENNRVSSKNGD